MHLHHKPKAHIAIIQALYGVILVIGQFEDHRILRLTS